MLISIWWVVVAFILGGTGGMLGLAIFSGMSEGEMCDNVNFTGMGQTR